MTNREQVDIWERWVIGVHLLFYGLLLYCSVQAWLDATPSEQRTIGGVGGGLAIWYALFLWRGMAYWENHQLRLALVFVIGWGLWLVVFREFGVYGLMPFALFPLLYFYMLPPWSVVGTIILAFLALTAGASDGPSSTQLLSGFLIMMVLLTIYMQAVGDQSFERKELIRELTQTRAELADAERRAGILQERQRLSREIHDTLAQGFISVVMQLESAVSVLASDQDQARSHITQATRTARISLDEARRFVRELRPEVLESGSLRDILPGIINEWATAAGSDAHFEMTGIPYDLPETVQNIILRVVQEALHNIQKHADAENAFVTLTFTPNTLLVDIVDDGVGFDTGKQISGRYGILGMRERTATIGGRLTVDSTPGMGTTITLEIPVGRER